jgi:hypothetical protein
MPDTDTIMIDTEQPTDSTEPESETDEPTDDEPDSFPRAYVEQLRRENAEQRVKAKRADELGQRLHLALVAATGRLADADDLPFDPAHLEDPEALTAAIDALLARKPHLASRRPAGDIGQGAGRVSEDVSLAGILRASAS